MFPYFIPWKHQKTLKPLVSSDLSELYWFRHNREITWLWEVHVHKNYCHKTYAAGKLRGTISVQISFKENDGILILNIQEIVLILIWGEYDFMVSIYYKWADFY